MVFRNANARLLTWDGLIRASLLRGKSVYQHAKKNMSLFSTEGVREFPVAVVQGLLVSHNTSYKPRFQQTLDHARWSAKFTATNLCVRANCGESGRESMPSAACSA
jgi:hypothetical protein